MNNSPIDPLSDKTIGYHLFLMPEGKVVEELTEVMEILANTFQGEMFAPHVTLLSRIPAESFGGLREEEIRAKCTQLASELSPFPIMLAGIGAKKSFFRALYLHVTNSEKISHVHARAREIFSMADESPYVPHLSLTYGNFPEEIVEEMKASVPLADAISFTATALHLYRTEGTVDKWITVGVFPFGDAVQ